ncbi:MAG: hypothetical protein ABMB14_27010 [Myxococcota bacterium]
MFRFDGLLCLATAILPILALLGPVVGIGWGLARRSGARWVSTWLSLPWPSAVWAAGVLAFAGASAARDLSRADTDPSDPLWRLGVDWAVAGLLGAALTLGAAAVARAVSRWGEPSSRSGALGSGLAAIGCLIAALDLVAAKLWVLGGPLQAMHGAHQLQLGVRVAGVAVWALVAAWVSWRARGGWWLAGPWLALALAAWLPFEADVLRKGLTVERWVQGIALPRFDAGAHPRLLLVPAELLVQCGRAPSAPCGFFRPPTAVAGDAAASALFEAGDHVDLLIRSDAGVFALSVSPSPDRDRPVYAIADAPHDLDHFQQLVLSLGTATVGELVDACLGAYAGGMPRCAVVR